MKKLSVFLIISLLFLLTSCSEAASGKKDEKNHNNNAKTAIKKETKELPDLNLQIAKSDENNGVTIENNPVYQIANNQIKKDPKAGVDNNFGMYAVDVLTKNSGEKAFLFIAVNRIHHSIKNITFDFTVGNKSGEYVWNKLHLDLSETKIGVLQPNSAVPIIIPLTNEQFNLVNSMKKENSTMEIGNLKYEKAN